MDYTMKQLEYWDERIRNIAESAGLDCYPQEFEICSYEDMLCYLAYTGMPSHYPHWSFGKAYEKNKTFYQYNLQGLPYEMVINSNPCIAYLIRENTLLLQILTMAHVYGHNDFFKNNRLFKEGTSADHTIQIFKNNSARVRNYISDPSIGYGKVERIINAGHALRYQTVRAVNTKRISPEEQRERLLAKYYAELEKRTVLDSKKDVPFPDLHKIPLEPEEDLLGFLMEYSPLEEWEKDLLAIVAQETRYFIPQIETKIMNEGWASFWHYKILSGLDLAQELHLEFLSRHNQVIRLVTGSLNPYYVGYKIFESLEKHCGPAKIFEVRQMERDYSFIWKYLTRELCTEMHLFQYQRKSDEYVIDELADEEGWQEIRRNLADHVGMGSIPVIKVVEVIGKDKVLLLEHEYDQRELEMVYARETLKYLNTLWDGKVILLTVMDGARKKIICEEGKISIS
ncbi:MAG: SpoVR family protein [Peptococcaceae bacterium]